MSSFREKYHQECRENGQAMNGRRCQLVNWGFQSGLNFSNLNCKVVDHIIYFYLLALQICKIKATF